jgi:hypothetical protein
MSDAREDHAIVGRVDNPINLSGSVPGGRASSGAAGGNGTTRLLLASGTLAGPLFVLVAAIQVGTRDGFDLRRHPLSLLSLGDLGWIQISNFIASGLLTLAFAAGMRRTLHPGRAGTWGPLLVGIFGLGLVIGGVFVTDPDLGFPPGMPRATQRSWHGIVHDIGPGVGFDALLLACLVVMRRVHWASPACLGGVLCRDRCRFVSADLVAQRGSNQLALGWRHRGCVWVDDSTGRSAYSRTIRAA